MCNRVELWNIKKKEVLMIDGYDLQDFMPNYQPPQPQYSAFQQQFQPQTYAPPAYDEIRQLRSQLAVFESEKKQTEAEKKAKDDQNAFAENMKNFLATMNLGQNGEMSRITAILPRPTQEQLVQTRNKPEQGAGFP